jgi:hypothetical protein
MLAFKKNQFYVWWLKSYPPYVTIELTVRRSEVRRKAGVGVSFRDRNFQG